MKIEVEQKDWSDLMVKVHKNQININMIRDRFTVLMNQLSNGTELNTSRLYINICSICELLDIQPKKVNFIYSRYPNE